MPNFETERILPMQINPKPSALVRALVGRVEVMTFSQEQRILKKLADTLDQSNEELKNEFGRFFEPKIRNILNVIRRANFSDSKKTQMIKKVKPL